MNHRLFFPLVLAVFFSLPLLAQTERGARFRVYSGNVGFRSERNENFRRTTSTTWYSASAFFQTGTFFRDNLAHGWAVSAAYSVNQMEGNSVISRQRSPQLSTSYFVRSYLDIHPRLRPFAQGSVGLRYTPFFFTNSNSSEVVTSHYLATFVNLDVGMTYFFKSNWAVEARTTLGYLSYDRTWSGGGTPGSVVSTFAGTSVPQNFSVGIARYFGGKSPSESLFPAKETGYQPGQRYFGGGFNSNVFFNSAARVAGVSLSKARFITPNRARGTEVSVSYATNRQNVQVGADTLYYPALQRHHFIGLGVSPFREFYWPLGTGRWSLFIQAKLGIFYGLMLFAKPEGLAIASAERSSRHQVDVSLGASPGIQCQLSPRWAAAAFIGRLSAGQVFFEGSRSPSRGFYQVKSEAGLNPKLSLESIGLSLRYFPQRRQQPG